MQNKIQDIKINAYLLVTSIYIIAASTQIINIIISITVGNNVGTFFEFINAPTDRTIVYILSAVTTVYITAKLRKTIPTILLCTFFLVSYFLNFSALDITAILLSLILLVLFLTSPQPFPTKDRKKAVSQVVTYVFLVLVIVEVLALICWFSFLFVPDISQEGACRELVELETKTFILTGSLAPMLAVLVLFSWVTKPVDHLTNRFAWVWSLFTQKGINEKTCQPSKKYKIAILACALALSVFVALYPFAPTLNTNMNPIGVDLPPYQTWLTQTDNQHFLEATSSFFYNQPDRPLSLFFMYITKVVTGLSASTVIQFFPVILAPALVFAVYFFVQETKTCKTSLVAALLAVSSFHIIVGVYGFFLSNWMAIIELYLFMAFCFGALTRKSVIYMIAALLFSLMLLFTHSWTWGMTIGVLFVYLVLTFVPNRKNLTANREEVLFIVILILVNISVCMTRNVIIGRSPASFETATIAQGTVFIMGLATFGSDLFYTFFNTHYGFFVNPMVLALAVLGGVATVRDNKPENRYLTAWLLGSSMFFLLAAGWTIKSRILLTLPFPFFAAIGLLTVTNVIDKIFDQTERSQIKNLVITFVVLVGLNYAFRCAFEMSQIA